MHVSRKRGFTALTYVLFCCLFGCNRGRVADLERENQQLRKKIEEQTQNADFDARAKCSEAAQTFVKVNDYRKIETFGTNPVTIRTTEFTSHYNKSLGRCYLYLTIDNSGPPFDGVTFVKLIDVFENSEVAGASLRREVKPLTLIICVVNGVKCSDPKEFAVKVQTSMEKQNP